MLNLAEPHVMSLKPYVPGRAIENDQSIMSWAKLASNENCLGPSPEALEAAKKSLPKAHLYPDAKRLLMVHEICRHLKDYGVQKHHVALGNGTSDLIVNLVRGLLGHDEQLVYGWPSFIMYRQAALTHGRKSIAVPLDANFDYDLVSLAQHIADPRNKAKLIILANPNNPTGRYLGKSVLHDFIRLLPRDVVLVIDEAYFEYVTKEDYESCLSFAMSRKRTIVLRTFSKAYGLAGMRLGYAVGDENIIAILCRIRDPFNVNAVVQDAAMAALHDLAHIKRSVEHNLKFRPLLTQGLRQLGFLVHESVGNFVMAKRSNLMPNIKDLCNKLSEKGVLLRPLDTYDLDDYVRISVGEQEEINQLFKALSTVLPSSLETCLLL